jgi:hypothetical protein
MKEPFDYTSLQIKTTRYDVNDTTGFKNPSIYGMWCSSQDVAELEYVNEIALQLLRRVVQLAPGWREAIVELEDFCSERVRLRNMMAAADQIDEWLPQAKAALALKSLG